MAMDAKANPVHAVGDERPLAELMKEALDETRELVKLEVALAREEVRKETREAKAAGIGIGAAAALAISGFTMLLVSVALAFSATWLPALLVGAIVLAAAGIAGLLGYGAVPRKPLDETRRRLTTDVNMVKERLA